MRLPETRVLFAAVWVASILASAAGAAEPEEPPRLLGRCTAEQLDQEPFREWFRQGYDEYRPAPEIVDSLRSIDRDGARITVFFGTWCGDSRREVPRLLKLLDAIDFPAADTELIGVDSVEAAHKRSPSGEERGLAIYRVPTVIVRRDGREVARIVEYPALSLERDLLAILEGRPYEPSYAAYPVVGRWLAGGLLADPNVSARGLADEIRSVVSGEGELAAAARVLLTRGETAEAVKLFEVNCVLHRESPGCFTQLAEALLRAGERKQAASATEKALRLDPDADEAEALIELIRKTGP